jgi:hypothetical protein
MANHNFYVTTTYHKPIVFNNITFHNLSILFKQGLDISCCCFVSQITNEDLERAYTTKARHDANPNAPIFKSET